MEYFLESIAGSLLKEFGNKLNHHCLVFPNRRAGLYFLKYLAARIDKPVWAPSVFTINELFRSYSELQIAGNEMLLFELYKAYRRIKKSAGSFDDFYFWGDMLLNDFDDVDKYLVNASDLFRNVRDIKKIDEQFGSLTDSQIEIIKRFWTNFDAGKPSDQKSGFISIWEILNELYIEFRASLKKQNIAYEGMIFREVAENSENVSQNDSHWELLHFIGFNALNECEKEVMLQLKKVGKARFYWDYDNSYIREDNLNSAGFFMRDNLTTFGNDMADHWNYDTMLSEGTIQKKRVIETSSDVAQAKLIPQLLKEFPDLTAENAHHTAIVLADENLLLPVLTSLPEDMGDINITMGFPLKQTLVYTFLKHLMNLQRKAGIYDGILRFHYKDVINILQHPLTEGLLTKSEKHLVGEIKKSNLVWLPENKFENSENLSRIFKKPVSNYLLSEYFKDNLSLIASSDIEEQAGDSVQRNIRNEYIYRIVLSINRLEPVAVSKDIIFTSETYIRILDRMLSIQSVPFSGEPLSGIQVMGILETRSLDFKNLIILSVNEGVLPSVSAGSSFIPFSLREAFGLPSVNHQESIYAYHFYRLLQRAENAVFMFNSNSEGLRSGEMSRFLTRMKYEKFLNPDFFNQSFEIKSGRILNNSIERKEEHTQLLLSRYMSDGKGTILSPSAINTWLFCSMKFYYRYVNGLREPEGVTEEIDQALLGNILHEIMRMLYFEYRGQVMSPEMIDRTIANIPLLQKITDQAIRDKFRDGIDGLITGNELVVRQVLMAYLKRILYADKKNSPFTILGLEDKYSFTAMISSGGKLTSIHTGGIVDRIDRISGVTRIVDYKTGTVCESISSISDLFEDDRKKEYDGWLQTLLYCEAYMTENKSATVQPQIYKIKKLASSPYSGLLKIKTDSKCQTEITDYKTVREEFVHGLGQVIEKIFNPVVPFVMTSDIRNKCQYCPYRSLCMR